MRFSMVLSVRGVWRGTVRIGAIGGRAGAVHESIRRPDFRFPQPLTEEGRTMKKWAVLFLVAGVASGLVGSDLVEYKLDYMTPGFIAWYGSGDGSNMMGGSERMPKLSSGWSATILCWDGTYDISDDAIIGSTPVETWGMVACLRGYRKRQRLSDDQGPCVGSELRLSVQDLRKPHPCHGLGFVRFAARQRRLGIRGRRGQDAYKVGLWTTLSRLIRRERAGPFCIYRTGLHRLEKRTSRRPGTGWSCGL